MYRTIIPFTLLAGFICLGAYSLQNAEGYSQHDIEAVNTMAADKCGDNWACVLQWSTEYHPPKHRH